MPFRTTEGPTPQPAIPFRRDVNAIDGNRALSNIQQSRFTRVQEVHATSRRPTSDPGNTLTRAQGHLNLFAHSQASRLNTNTEYSFTPRGTVNSHDIRHEPNTNGVAQLPAYQDAAQENPQTVIKSNTAPNVLGVDVLAGSLIQDSSAQFTALLSSGALDAFIEQGFQINGNLQSLEAHFSGLTDRESLASLSQISADLSVISFSGSANDTLSQIKQQINEAKNHIQSRLDQTQDGKPAAQPRAAVNTAVRHNETDHSVQPNTTSAASTDTQSVAFNFDDILAEVTHHLTQSYNNVKTDIKALNAKLPITLPNQPTDQQIELGSIRRSLQDVFLHLKGSLNAADHVKSGSWSQADGVEVIQDFLLSAQKELRALDTKYQSSAQSIDQAIKGIKLTEQTLKIPAATPQQAAAKPAADVPAQGSSAPSESHDSIEADDLLLMEKVQIPKKFLVSAKIGHVSYPVDARRFLVRDAAYGNASLDLKKGTKGTLEVQGSYAVDIAALAKQLKVKPKDIQDIWTKTANNRRLPAGRRHVPTQWNDQIRNQRVAAAASLLEKNNISLPEDVESFAITARTRELERTHNI